MKPWFVIWSLLAPVLAGVCITALLLMPAMAPRLGLWIVVAAVVSAVVTVPMSVVIGKSLQ